MTTLTDTNTNHEDRQTCKGRLVGLNFFSLPLFSFSLSILFSHRCSRPTVRSWPTATRTYTAESNIHKGRATIPLTSAVSKTDWEGHWHPTGRASLVWSSVWALMGREQEREAEVHGAAYPFLKSFNIPHM